MAKPKGFNLMCWLGILSYLLLFLTGWASSLLSILTATVALLDNFEAAATQPIEISLIDEMILALTYILGLYQAFLISKMQQKRMNLIRPFLICLGTSTTLAWLNVLWSSVIAPQASANVVIFNAFLLTILAAIFSIYFSRQSVTRHLEAKT